MFNLMKNHPNAKLKHTRVHRFIFFWIDVILGCWTPLCCNPNHHVFMHVPVRNAEQDATNSEWISGLAAAGELKALLRLGPHCFWYLQLHYGHDYFIDFNDGFSIRFTFPAILLCFTLHTVGRSKGKIHLSWIQGAFVDSKCNKCSLDMPERHFVINTVAWRNLRIFWMVSYLLGIVFVDDHTYLCWSIVCSSRIHSSFLVLMARARSIWLPGSLFLSPSDSIACEVFYSHVSSSLLFTIQWVESIASLCFIHYYWLAALFCGFCSFLFWGELFFDFCCYHSRRGFQLGHHPEGSVYAIRGHNCHLSNGQRVTTFWNHSNCFVSLTSSHATKKIRRKGRDTGENERLPPYCFAYFPCCIPFWKTPKHFVPKSHSSSLLPEVFHQQDVSAGRIVVHIMSSIVLSMFWGGSFAITNPCRFPPTWQKLRSTCGVVHLKRQLQTAKETKPF